MAVSRDSPPATSGPPPPPRRGSSSYTPTSGGPGHRPAAGPGTRLPDVAPSRPGRAARRPVRGHGGSSRDQPDQLTEVSGRLDAQSAAEDAVEGPVLPVRLRRVVLGQVDRDQR